MEKSKPNKGSSRKKPVIKLSKNERRFIIISDFLIVGFIIVDFLFIADLIKVNLMSFALANLIMVAFTYYYYRFKRRIAIRALRKDREVK